MRTLAALLIFVSLRASSFSAEVTRASEPWNTKRAAALAAMDRRDFASAAALFQQCWSESRTAAERGISANDAGIAFNREGRPRDAAIWLERSLNEWRREPAQSALLAKTARSLFSVNRDLGNYAGAELVVRDAIARETEPSASRALKSDLADLLREQGRAAEARQLFESGLSSAASSTDRILALIGLADLDRQEQSWDSAVSRSNEAADLARQINSTGLEAIALREAGNSYLDSGNTARAEPLLRRALFLFEDARDKDSQQVADTVASLGNLYRMENKPGLAEDALTRALDLKRRFLGPEHPQLAIVMQMLAELLARNGDFEESRIYSRQSLEILTAHFGEASLPVAIALANSAEIERAARDTVAAADRFRRSIAALRTANPGNAVLLASVLDRYAELLKTMHKGREAKILLAEARSLR